jgi:hypothetical protein
VSPPVEQRRKFHPILRGAMMGACEFKHLSDSPKLLPLFAKKLVD